MCFSMSFVVNSEIILAETDVIELVFGGPAPRERRLLLVYHRVEEFEPLIWTEGGVLTRGLVFHHPCPRGENCPRGPKLETITTLENDKSLVEVN